MKRKITAVLAALMVMSMGTVTAFAATSPTTENTQAADYAAAVEEVTIEGVGPVEIAAVTDEEVTAAQQEAAKLATSDTTATIKAIIDVKADNGGKATFAVPSVKAGANIVILHLGANGWETITPDSVEEGKVTATFTSFSPVVIVELAAKGGSTGETYNPGSYDKYLTSTDTTTVPSPQTGETAPFLPVIAVICLAGIAVCGKKMMTVSNK